jgi:hypothetical protein
MPDTGISYAETVTAEHIVAGRLDLDAAQAERVVLALLPAAAVGTLAQLARHLPQCALAAIAAECRP